MSKILKITLKKSLVGTPEKHRKTVRSLGLGKLNSVVTLKESPNVRGMIQKIFHMVQVEEIADEAQ
jgi:large subunit ribosomal protein L30